MLTIDNDYNADDNCRSFMKYNKNKDNITRFCYKPTLHLDSYECPFKMVLFSQISTYEQKTHAIETPHSAS